MGLIGKLPAISPNNAYCEDFDKAYFKVEGVFIDTERDKVRISVRGWTSEYARQNAGIGIFKRVFYSSLDFFAKTKCSKQDLTKRAYEFIKTMPEFVECRGVMKAYAGRIDITQEKAKSDKEDLDALIDSFKE